MAEYEAYIERYRRWNFFVNAADLSAVHLAGTFIFSTTILTLYASYLTGSALLIGLIPAIQQVGYLFPQLFTAHRAEYLKRKKPFVVKISIVERVPYLFVTLGILFWPNAPRWAAYLVLAFSIALATGSAGLASPAWKAMLGKIIRPDRRGLLFGLGFSIGGGLGIGGSLLARHILNTGAYPFSFGTCFLLSFIFQGISWVFLTLNKEPARTPKVESRTFREYIKRLPQVLEKNPDFKRYLISMYLVIFGGMGISFYVVFARITFGISDGFAATLTLTAMLSQTGGTFVLGWLGDRRGHKWLIEICIVFGMAAVSILVFIPNVYWMYAVFVLMNLSIVGIKVAQSSITMEFGPVDQLPTYTALAGTLLGIPTFLAPLAGGAIVDVGGYKSLFICGFLLYFAGLATVHYTVKDPRFSKK